MHIDDIKIDPELRDLLPPLSDKARKTLRDDIVTSGRIRDSLIVWEETGILVEGHNRHGIYVDESDKEMIEPPTIRLMSFPSRLAVMEWMIRNQEGRRNWTKEQEKYARGKLLIETKKTPETQERAEGGVFAKSEENPEKSPSRQNVAAVETEHQTAAKIGAEHGGVSSRTVERDAIYAAAVDKITQVNAKAGADIRSGSLKLTNDEVLGIAGSGDIGKALKNHRMYGDWKGKPPAEPEDAPAAPDDDDVVQRAGLAMKSYNVLANHMAWLKNRVDHGEKVGKFNLAGGGLKQVHDVLTWIKRVVK
jgi:hypothetical protein